ncbi:MAG: hypothetical protein NW216_11505 [Hyphomicrobium sp.]|nr:hypothetical protein [Hyphomicrobium sp.]
MGAGTELGLRIGRSVALWLPIGLVSAAGGYALRLVGPRTRRQRRVLENIGRAFPSTSDAERRAIAAEMWDNFGRTAAESLIIDRVAADPGRVVLATPEVLQAGDTTKGILFVGLHFGNWETTAIPGVEQSLELMGFYKASKDELFNAWLEAIRKPIYPGGIFAATPSTLLKLTRHVRQGRSACILADHRDPTGVNVSFFGSPAPSTALPGLLHARYGIRIIGARVERLPGARFRIHLEPIHAEASGDESRDIHAMTQSIQAVFERWIKERPGQWTWFYKRWLGQR